MKRLPKLLTSTALLLTLTLGLVYANNTLKTEKIQTVNYKNMSTSELQIAVEKLSNEGNLPFEMGLELMKRWQTEQTSV